MKIPKLKKGIKNEKNVGFHVLCGFLDCRL